VSHALHVFGSCVLCLAPPAVDLLEALCRCVCTRRACCFLFAHVALLLLPLSLFLGVRAPSLSHGRLMNSKLLDVAHCSLLHRSCKMRCFCDSKMDQGFFQVEVSSFQPREKARGICSRKGAHDHVWRGIHRQARAGARQRSHLRQERGPLRPRVRKRCLRGARRAWWRTCSAIVQHHRVIRARPRVARA